jgi:hypothetical protein
MSLWLYGPCRAFASLTMPAHSVLSFAMSLNHKSCVLFHSFGRRILGSGRLLVLVFSTIVVLRDGVVSPMPNPQPGGPGLRIYDPRRQGGPVIPPGTGYSF